MSIGDLGTRLGPRNRKKNETIFRGRRGRVSFRCSTNQSAVSLTAEVYTCCMGIYIVPSSIAHNCIPVKGGGGGGRGYSVFPATGMIELGQKSKPKKISRTFNNTPKNPWTKK